jgi:hypothetical protein
MADRGNGFPTLGQILDALGSIRATYYNDSVIDIHVYALGSHGASDPLRQRAGVDVRFLSGHREIIDIDPTDWGHVTPSIPEGYDERQ